MTNRSIYLPVVHRQRRRSPSLPRAGLPPRVDLVIHPAPVIQKPRRTPKPKAPTAPPPLVVVDTKPKRPPKPKAPAAPPPPVVVDTKPKRPPKPKAPTAPPPFPTGKGGKGG